MRSASGAPPGVLVATTVIRLVSIFVPAAIRDLQWNICTSAVLPADIVSAGL